MFFFRVCDRRPWKTNGRVGAFVDLGLLLDCQIEALTVWMSFAPSSEPTYLWQLVILPHQAIVLGSVQGCGLCEDLLNCMRICWIV